MDVLLDTIMTQNPIIAPSAILVNFKMRQDKAFVNLVKLVALQKEQAILFAGLATGTPASWVESLQVVPQ